MDPHLDRLQKAMHTEISGLSADRLHWHPDGKWSTAEVLEHLYLTYTGTVKGFERLLASGKPDVKPCTLQERAKIFVVTGLGYLPSGRQAPSMARPKGVESQKVLAEIGSTIQAMDDIIGRCEDRFGAGTKLLTHPILGPLTGREWRKFHLVHGLHHLKQIQRLQKMQDSRKSG